ncbi:BCCT family transporter [Paenibacillus urinalis]|uniref:BCCT family transporter n=2 Tax=Paenibacillus TaxID=44249 RepID=A0AAX3MT49_9BACL|nr:MULTISPECIES: BCCT family transporter [Paenibacillus]WDH80402.1 BCCT family transporter [Paenibacillus urinalis]WDH96442.1 BCCT family transporter [Paenibacillus urinalis]WDI04666.1 BCCT family transporter [Paenibacillus urinalis]GAK40578.1 choline/carnitine/betaine transporter [Paenibacillus sp. TCA20]
MIRKLMRDKVFSISAIIITLLAVLGALMPDAFGNTASMLYNLTTNNFGWFYLLSIFVIIVFLIWVAASKYGTIRLGGEKEKPQYPFFTWIGMLFSAGFGVGLVFWGVAEPMSHFFDTPFGGVASQSEEAARVAMGYSFFHWGISQWSVFALVGLVIAFLQFRKEKDGLVSTALEPVTGNKPAVKKTIDILAVIATVMGIATSIGLGVMQMSGGISTLTGTSNGTLIQLGILVAIFIAYMISSTTGLDKGIKYLSNLNLGVALLFLLFVFTLGPTVFILETFTLALGDYITNFISYSLRLQPYTEGTWVRDWTIFYWAWAIAWSPYVGAFVARVSRGRTIREFIVGVMVVPPLIACLWIATFGGTAIWFDLHESTGIAAAVNEDVTSALFQLFGQLPFSTVMSILSILLILTFLVTSADSATYILSSMTTKGSLNPPMTAKVVWGTLMAAIAGVLLYSGGLEALQTASLIAALPFTVILLLLIIAVVKLLRKEPLPIRKADLRRYRRLEEAANKASDKPRK